VVDAFLARHLTTTVAGHADGQQSLLPGLAQRAQTSISNATDLISGYITASENDFKSRVKFINDQVASMELRVTAYETRLRAQFATLEATIATLKSQSNYLGSQITAFTNNTNGK